MSFDTERVILEVQCRPGIWDQGCELYKDRSARTAAWIEVCKELFADFDSFSEAEKQTTVTKVQSRWKTARDTYIRVNTNKKKLKSGSNVKSTKTYIYYDMLKFLDSNSCYDADESIDVLCDPHQHMPDDIDISIVPSTSVAKLERTPSTETAKVKKRKFFENELLLCDNQSKIDDDDEDLHFFKSLIPTLKTFSNYNKLLFRAKVLDILMNMEEEHIL